MNFNQTMLTWEDAFVKYVKGLETKNVKIVDEALVIMKEIDAELTAAIWLEDMLTVREWRKLDTMVSELVGEGSTRFKKVEDAQEFLSYVYDMGIVAKVKSHYGKWFTVELKQI